MRMKTAGERFTRDESAEWLAQRMLKLDIANYEEFSLLTGIDRGTISRYFRHERRPSIDVIAPLCQVLKVSPETLLIVLGALDKKTS
jgi:transcriptional regulator with XRE-family HTH domain